MSVKGGSMTTTLTAQHLAAELEQQKIDAAAIRSLWESLFVVETPNDLQLRIWLSTHSLHTMALAVRQASKKYNSLNERMSFDHLVRHISKVANTTERFDKLMKEKEKSKCQNN
jgi:predicted alpha/beta-fold hydrolase